MKSETINKLIKHLKAIKEAGITIEQYEKINNLNSRFIINKIYSVKVAHEDEAISDDTFNTVMNLYESVKQRKSRNSDIEDTDNRSEVTLDRDENGKIIQYNFSVNIRDKAPLTGHFTRDEMSLIYRLYSSYGSNITQREVSRFFPEYSLCDFKRILRTFNITKASAPFPQHIIEENDKATLLDMQFREKENDFLKSYEADKVRQMDQQLKKYMKENYDLKNQIQSFSNINLNLTGGVSVTPKPSNSKKDLFIYLSDMHIGASVGENSLYNNTYDAKEVQNRLNKIYNTVYNTDGYDSIIVCNIGDSLDGEYNQTTRGGHYLPQNMDEKQQIKCFLESMYGFFTNLSTIPHNEIKYYAVGESNHGGVYEYASQIALSKVLDTINVKSTVWDKFIGHFIHKGHTYICSHGKDNKDMFKNWPLTLNDKTEGIINEYMDINNISTATVIKGDLHQSAITYGKRFTYRSVGSMFGSSGWIMKNFGNTHAACDYSIVDENQSLDGRIILNQLQNQIN